MNADQHILEGCSVLPALNGAASKPSPNTRPEKPGRTGRFAVLNAFTDATIRGLDGSAVKVWLILFRDTKPDGLARASDTDLAHRAGVSARTVYNARKLLERAGLLRVVRKGRLGAGGSVYRVFPLAQPEAGCQLQPATGRQKPRKRVAGIPEGDQKGRVDPDGSDAGEAT